MHTATVLVQRDVETCWRAFVEVAKAPSWVPGLKRAEILTRSRGLPEEVHFEFGQGHAYTLVYSYDKKAREISWQPKLGPKAGVTGYVRFIAVATGTEITYALEHGDARGPQDRELGDVTRLADAFSAFILREYTGNAEVP
jgi:hypothetical protein